MRGAVHNSCASAVKRDAPDIEAAEASHEVHPADQRPRAPDPRQRRRSRRVRLHPRKVLHGDERRRVPGSLALRPGGPPRRSYQKVLLLLLWLLVLLLLILLFIIS